jgi:hypothetical protein
MLPVDGDQDDAQHVRWQSLGIFASAMGFLVLGVIVVAVVSLFLVLHSFGSDEPVLSRAARTQIARADCKQLDKLYARYVPNGDSVEPDITGLRLTVERQTKLGCAPTTLCGAPSGPAGAPSSPSGCVPVP